MPERPRVTVVNDDPDFLAMIGEVLSDENYAVTLVDAEESEPLDRIARSNPDLLIIDLRLASDELRGWQVLRSVRAAPQFERLPVLLLSGDVQALEQLEHELAEMRNAMSLAKPFGLDVLDEAVAHLLNSNEPA